MDIPSPDQIVGALERSGYLFEQEVANAMESLGFHVDTSWAFADSDSGKSREIDVKAIKAVLHDESTKTQVFVELLIECKDFGSPLVFLERKKNARLLSNTVPVEYVFPKALYKKPPTGPSYQEVAAFDHLSLRNRHYFWGSGRQSTQFAKIVRKGSEWVANHDGVYDALILPLTKVLNARKKEIRSSAGDWRITWLFFPLVVVRDHLYAFDPASNPREPQERGRVSFIRHLEIEKAKGFYVVDFVKAEYLPTFIGKEIGSFWSAIVEIAQANPKILRGDA